MNRRGFLQGGLIILGAPAIVRAESLMKVVAPKIILPARTWAGSEHSFGYNKEEHYTWLRSTYKTPDGMEYHNLTRRTGGNFLYSEEGSDMIRVADMCYQRHVDRVHVPPFKRLEDKYNVTDCTWVDRAGVNLDQRVYATHT